jgi:hypothetical protein
VEIFARVNVAQTASLQIKLFKELSNGLKTTNGFYFQIDGAHANLSIGPTSQVGSARGSGSTRIKNATTG